MIVGVNKRKILSEEAYTKGVGSLYIKKMLFAICDFILERLNKLRKEHKRSTFAVLLASTYTKRLKY